MSLFTPNIFEDTRFSWRWHSLNGNQLESVKSFSHVASVYLFLVFLIFLSFASVYEIFFLLMSSEYPGILLLCFAWALSRMFWIKLIPFLMENFPFDFDIVLNCNHDIQNYGSCCETDFQHAVNLNRCSKSKSTWKCTVKTCLYR